MSSITTLDISQPHGIYWVINPFKESDRGLAKLMDSNLKCPVDMESVHPQLHHFYALLKPMEFGPLLMLFFFWFGAKNKYCAIGVGPFGCMPDYKEEMMHFQ